MTHRIRLAGALLGALAMLAVLASALTPTLKKELAAHQRVALHKVGGLDITACVFGAWKLAGWIGYTAEL